MAVKILFTDEFKRSIQHVKDTTTRRRVEELIDKIRTDPFCGKPLKYDLKGMRSVRMKPFRIIYLIEGDAAILLRFGHRENVYK